VDPPVGLRHRDLDPHLAVRRPQHLGDVVAQLEPLGGEPEPVRDDLVVRDLRTLLRLDRGAVAHRSPP
jgi:hypothetical protein